MNEVGLEKFLKTRSINLNDFKAMVLGKQAERTAPASRFAVVSKSSSSGAQLRSTGRLTEAPLFKYFLFCFNQNFFFSQIYIFN
jgi:hypothetical protein